MGAWLIFLLIIIVLFLLVGLYVKKKRIAKAATIVRNSSETIVDDAMKFVAETSKNFGVSFSGTKGNSVADVWGQLVVGFNYKAEVTQELSDTKNISGVREKIDLALKDYSKEHHLEDREGPLLRVSDIWINDRILDIDVVYLINQQTKDYLKDLSKL